VTRPTLSQAEAWRPDELRRLADAWDRTALELHTHVRSAAAAVPDAWTGAAADEARRRAHEFCERGDGVARALIMAAVAARDAADQLAGAQRETLALADTARREGFRVCDDGTVMTDADPSPLLILLSGSNTEVAAELLQLRATELSRLLNATLDRLAAADADAARDLEEAFAGADGGRAASTAPAGAHPTGADTGWDERVADNRAAIAQAILDQAPDERNGEQRIALYRSLLGEVDDPAGTGQRVDRQILTFDPARSTLIELNGDLHVAKSVAVLVPGMNTTMEGSAANTTTARQFVAASEGEVAAITFLGGPFPQDEHLAVALAEAADPRFAVDMAPRLVAFSHDVDRVVDGMGRDMSVTYVGHSYGGAILGTAEALGLTADQTVYVAAAGTGFGVDDPGDWHNRNPDVVRFAMTAPADPIQLVQGVPGGPYGADPDDMPGVVQLATGRYDNGRLMAGPAAHTDVINCVHSDAWRNLLAVIAGDREHVRLAR
jgi:Alpha/beta hydrolase